MKDAPKPPTRPNEEILSPTGLPHHSNHFWLSEVLPRGINSKVEWITLNLLHKLQDRTCTRESVILATTAMPQWVTQIMDSVSDEEQEDAPAEASATAQSSADAAPVGIPAVSDAPGCQ